MKTKNKKINKTQQPRMQLKDNITFSYNSEVVMRFIDMNMQLNFALRLYFRQISISYQQNRHCGYGHNPGVPSELPSPTPLLFLKG